LNRFESEILNLKSEGMSEEPNKIQLAVIGGGPGGYAAAFLAADLGMQVP
jgi:NADPH-dependent 2,4-dienoyl-CoA reductase/sulfur reductase-like enzyme